jgi:hypothetical protein
MLTGDTNAAAELVKQAAESAAEPEPEPEVDNAASAVPASKKKQKEGWRAVAARKFEEAKVSASRTAAEVSAQATQARMSASVAVVNARSDYERSKLAGRVAKEDKYAMAWRNTCMTELDDDSAAEARIAEFAAAGTIEVDNPMALRALSTVDMSCSNLSARLVDQDLLVESMAKKGEAFAAAQMKVLKSAEANFLQLVPAAMAADGETAAEITRIIDACEASSYASWSAEMRTTLTEKSTAFAQLHKEEIQTIRKEFIVTTSASREALKAMLADKTTEGFEEKKSSYTEKQRMAEAARAQLAQV